MTASERAELAALVADLGGQVRFELPLGELTTWRIGGPAEAVVAVTHRAALVAVARLARQAGWPLRWLGNGSNLLCPDQGVRGVVLHLCGHPAEVTWRDHTVVAEAGAFLPKLAREAAARGSAGLECVGGVPGTVGGGVVLNAGIPAGTISDHLAWVEVLTETGEVVRRSPADLAFGHRTSRLQREPWLVLAAGFSLAADEPGAVSERLNEHLAYRRRTQPLGEPSCGSVFRRPPDDYPGRLIEAVGGKGLRRGDAEVSAVHANWIINRGQATAADVRALMAEIQARVARQFGVDLVPEVIVWEE